MEYVYWYFLKNVVTGEMRNLPYYSEKWIGDIGECVYVGEIKYKIMDYAEEAFYPDDLQGEVNYYDMRGYK
jgi:hypothetical protein